MLSSLFISFPVVPPTSNRLYFHGTKLTQVARDYAEAFAKYAAQNHLHQISQMNPDGIFAVHLRFYFESLENETWNDLSIKPSRRAKTRFKKIDLTNRIKLLEDCIRDALDIDDSHTFAGSQEKHQDPKNPRVDVYVNEVSPELFGLRTII